MPFLQWAYAFSSIKVLVSLSKFQFLTPLHPSYFCAGIFGICLKYSHKNVLSFIIYWLIYTKNNWNHYSYNTESCLSCKNGTRWHVTCGCNQSEEATCIICGYYDAVLLLVNNEDMVEPKENTVPVILNRKPPTLSNRWARFFFFFFFFFFFQNL